MRVRCKFSPVDDEGNKIFNLTKGKEYNIVTHDFGKEYCSIMDDNFRFISFSEWMILFEELDNEVNNQK